MSPGRSRWMNIACLVGGVFLGLAVALLWTSARPDDAELRTKLDALAQRLAELDARLASSTAAPVAGLDALEMQAIVRAALDETLGSSARAVPGEAARVPSRPAPTARSDRWVPVDQDSVRSAVQNGDPEEMRSVTREVMRSLDQ